jgi:hypothetical protein
MLNHRIAGGTSEDGIPPGSRLGERALGFGSLVGLGEEDA